MKESLDKSEVDGLIFKEFVKNGYARTEGHKSWDIAQRRFLYLTPELAEGFLKLYDFDVYRRQIVEREENLLKEQIGKIVEEIGEDSFNLIDVFCGDGRRVVELLKMMGLKNKIRYCPVNACSYLTDKAVAGVKAAGLDNVTDFKPMMAQGDGRTLRYLDKDLKAGEYKKNVILILGTVIASFDINEYLFEMSKDMGKEDYLIIGNGIRMGERLVEIDKYKRSEMSDWIVHLVKGLGFTEDEVEYDARFGNKRVEMFFRVKKDKMIKHDGKEVEFKAGDEILAFYLYKYYKGEFEDFCRMYFSSVSVATDKDEGYALAMCKK